MRDPFEQILKNAKGGQAWNAWHQQRGCNRPVKTFSITADDVKNKFFQQEGKSYWLGIPINPMDVFKSRYPLSPSLDRLDNSKGYTVDNICISTRFENYGFNKCSDYVKEEIKFRLNANPKSGLEDFMNG